MFDSSRTERPAFLGVERSLTGKRWATRLGDERQALAIAQRHGCPTRSAGCWRRATSGSTP